MWTKGYLSLRTEKGDLDSPCIYFTIDNDIITGISLYSASNIS